MIVATRPIRPSAALPIYGNNATRQTAKPLYLLGRCQTTVSVDGPALKVVVEQRASQRYPFARVARIISGQRVDWRADALACCQQQRLPIVFIGAEQQVTGYLQPAQAKRSSLDRLIEEFLDRPDWPSHYRNWQRAERMDLLLRWRAERHQAGTNIDPSDFDELVRRHVYHPDDARFRVPVPVIPAGMITAYVLQVLDRAGLQACYWGDQGHPLALADELDRLLQLAMQLEISGCGSEFHSDQATLLRLAHAFGNSLQSTLQRLLGRLHRRLRTTLEQWH
ncbi:MAG: hypothetical protein CO182_02745 [Lysobacterales bacterium CG_4_9_14_3_um_filter_62_6]|nr:MAG: hypothetical protein CO182_02745 [Xanthomonadales bacterium CG_4_9_14_3_um_filter_62_6]